MLKFKCPFTGLVIAVKHESELPEGQVFQRVPEDKPADVPAVHASIYAPLTWAEVISLARGR